MNRFLCPTFINAHQKIVSIAQASEIHHLKNVLRLKKGDTIIIFNGQGLEAIGCVLTASKKSIDIEIIEMLPKKKQQPLLILACAIPKKTKFEMIIEKCTELGVDEIIPLITARTEIKFDNAKTQRKHLRYQAVAMNAAKQSQRATLPKIHPIMHFTDALKLIDPNTTGFIGCLFKDRKPLAQAFAEKKSSHRNTIFFIGPEGDFTQQEVDAAIAAGCMPIDLGNTVLKVDTAAIAVISFARLLTRTH